MDRPDRQEFPTTKAMTVLYKWCRASGILQTTQEIPRAWLDMPQYLSYRASVLFIRKKEGTLRMCINFRVLNKQTKLDTYLLPRIDDILDRQSVAW